jgi:glycosyltransferase involved in cell wall biosynthesis
MTEDAAVVHVCESLAAGILKVVPALANRTAQRGIPTVVVHGRRPETPPDVANAFDPRIRVIPVPGWGDRSPFGIWMGTVRAATQLSAELRRFRGGILHLHSTHAGFIGRIVPAPGWARFYTPQGYAFLNDSHSRAVRLLILAAESLLVRQAQTLACSRFEGAEAARLSGGRGVSVVQNGVELEPVPVARAARDRFVVASIGRAVHQRRPDLFAHLAELLRDDGATELHWYGDGPDRKILLAGGVDVSGWLPPAEVADAIAGTDVLVHFSAFEGLPLALLEAMAAGRAVVASDLPVIREVLGDAGVLVRDAVGAADAVRQLRRNAAWRGELATRARQRVQRLFTTEAMVDRTLAVYGL